MGASGWTIVEVTPDNHLQETLFCAKNPKDPGYREKLKWLAKEQQNGLRLSILKKGDRNVGFIEWMPAERAWRPIDAPGYLFVQCIMVAKKSDRQQGAASLLIDHVCQAARDQKKKGVAVMTSKGTWMADEGVFLKNGFTPLDRSGRFELYAITFHRGAGGGPRFMDWTVCTVDYPEWTLLYANQCPWHVKAAAALRDCAAGYGIDLFVHEVTDPQEAQTMPGGSGTFALLHRREVLADHYISTTRFTNILGEQGLLNPGG